MFKFKILSLFLLTSAILTAGSLRFSSVYFKKTKMLRLHMTSSHGMEESRGDYRYNWYEWELDLSKSTKPGVVEISQHKNVFRKLHQYMEEQIGSPKIYRNTINGNAVSVSREGGRGDIDWPFEDSVSWQNIFYLYAIDLAMNGYSMTFKEEEDLGFANKVVYWFRD